MFQSIWEKAKAARGAATDTAGTLTPRLSNREASAIIGAARALAPMLTGVRLDPRTFPVVDGVWPLWYQFAAIAYGWDATRDKLDVSPAHADRLYPIDQTAQLWHDVHRMINAMEVDRPDVPAQLDLDSDTHNSAIWQGEVRKALKDDGAQASFVIGFGGCKEGKPKKDPKTGKWKCTPVPIKDPVSHGVSGLPMIIMVVILAWALTQGERPGRRRD